MQYPFLCFVTEEDDKVSTILDKSNASLPSDIHPAENNLNSITTPPLEVEYTFKSLRLGKASGSDIISNRIQKRLATLISIG